MGLINLFQELNYFWPIFQIWYKQLTELLGLGWNLGSGYLSYVCKYGQRGWSSLFVHLHEKQRGYLFIFLKIKPLKGLDISHHEWAEAKRWHADEGLEDDAIEMMKKFGEQDRGVGDGEL